MIVEAKNHIIDYESEDPVRPNIPKENRINETSKVFYYVTSLDVHVETQTPEAVICVKFCDRIATTESELETFASLDSTVLMLYTVWSNSRGAGATLVRELLPFVKEQFPNIKRVCTLSPKTRTARVFHLRNGAIELRENSETINYEYILEQ